MNYNDPVALACVLAEAVLTLVKAPTTTVEHWRKVAGHAEDLARLARRQEELWKTHCPPAKGPMPLE